ncbi:hypothetical protein ACH5RR_039824 [Cinchona calisaya]|uniref:AT5G11810-like protein n=1 Tax=Cinchona calisaya TaxID=153742 RepID=A0ABD2Y126_9GENT
MADKASRALVLYGDGLASSISLSQSHHLHSLASLSSCGFLTLPHSPPSENVDAGMIREFAELLDSAEAYGSENEKESSEAKSSLPFIPERFMGMKAAVITDNSDLQRFGSKLGLTILQLNEITGSSHSRDDSSIVASQLLKLLGFEGGKTLQTNQFDLLFLHMGAGEEPNGLLDIEHVNDLVGALLHLAKPGNEISSRLHLSVIMSYGAFCGDENSSLSLNVATHDSNSNLSLLFPRQSYTIKQGKPRENVRHHSPMLIAQWQNAVTRKDMVETYSFSNFKELGGNLAIPADRFLHEVAFKLWKAPKYGA